MGVISRCIRPLAEVAHRESRCPLVPRSRNRGRILHALLVLMTRKSTPCTIRSWMRSGAGRGTATTFAAFCDHLHSGSRPPGVRGETVSRHHQS